MSTTPKQVAPPNLPLPPEEYDRKYFDQLTNVLRLYFMAVTNSVNNNVAVNGQINLGGYYLWVDATGDLRIKDSKPTSDLDGTVVGTQT